MKNLTRFVLALCLLAGAALYGLYCFNSGRVFFKAMQFRAKGNCRSAGVAHLVVAGKFPLSPFSTASRAILFYDDAMPALENSSLSRELEESSFLARTPLTRSWSLFYVDYFALAAILVFGLACLHICDPLGIRNKIAPPGKKVFLVFVFLASLGTFAGWASAVSGQPLVPAVYDAMAEIGVLTPEAVIGLSMIWALYGIFLAGCSVKLLFCRPASHSR